jgi:hypothetical protein
MWVRGKEHLRLKGRSDPLPFAPDCPQQKVHPVYDERSEAVPGTQQLQVYDPVAKHEIAWGVDKDGQRSIQTIVIDGMKKGIESSQGRRRNMGSQGVQ